MLELNVVSKDMEDAVLKVFLWVLVNQSYREDSRAVNDQCLFKALRVDKSLVGYDVSRIMKNIPLQCP